MDTGNLLQIHWFFFEHGGSTSVNHIVFDSFEFHSLFSENQWSGGTRNHLKGTWSRRYISIYFLLYFELAETKKKTIFETQFELCLNKTNESVLYINTQITVSIKSKNTIPNYLKSRGVRLFMHLDMLLIDPTIHKSFKKLFLVSENVLKSRLIITNQTYLIISLSLYARKLVWLV